MWTQPVTVVTAASRCARRARGQCGACCTARTAWQRSPARLVLLRPFLRMLRRLLPHPRLLHTATRRSRAFNLAFIFPGLGAIYNRQYNKGLIHIAIFASIILGLSSDLDGGFKAMLGILLAGFIFYTAFEAMQTAQAKNRGEIPPDPLESWSKDRPIGAIILIGLGVLFLLDNFHIFDFIRIGRLWPLILIAAGLYMFRNKLGVRS